MDNNSKSAPMETPPRTPRKDAEEVWQHQTIQLAPDKQRVARSQPTRVSLEPETPMQSFRVQSLEISMQNETKRKNQKKRKTNPMA